MTQEDRNQIWQEARENSEDESKEEEEELSPREEIEQLQHEYDRAMSAIERNKNQDRPERNSGWKEVAQQKREELIEAKEGRIEELAEYSGEVGHNDHRAISTQNDIRDAIGKYESDIEELRKEGEN